MQHKNNKYLQAKSSCISSGFSGTIILLVGESTHNKKNPAEQFPVIGSKKSSLIFIDPIGVGVMYL